jgi:FMN phosphatase YigB (HAD superfamily)
LLFWLDGDVEIGLNVQMNVKSSKTSLQNFKFPNRSEYQAVFFDMDGTLIDSEAMAAQVIMESVVRLIPGVLEKSVAVTNESFSEMLAEYPQYTKPEEFMGKKVPDTLLSGNHKEIDKWKAEHSIKY